MSKSKVTTEDFIKRIQEIFPTEGYDFSEVNYVDAKTPVKIICPVHGEFYKRPYRLVMGQGCQKCGWSRIGDATRNDLEDLIDRFKKVHGDEYDYSKVILKSISDPVTISCQIHGDFQQRPGNHLRGDGCPICAGLKRRSNTEEFIKKSKEVHGDKYDYSKVVYTKSTEKVTIICPEHGEFEQSASNHLRGKGCPKCAIERNSNNQRLTTEEFILRSIKIHGDKYDYSKTVYIDDNTKLTVTCPDHGDFLVLPSNHIKRKSGCPVCRQSHLETSLRVSLLENNIDFTQYMKFDWLGLQSLDFYIPSLNIGIECQGLQHYIPKDHFKGLPGYIHRRYLDMKKQRLCRENGVTLLYFTLPEFSSFDPSAYVTTRSLLARLRQ